MYCDFSMYPKQSCSILLLYNVGLGEGRVELNEVESSKRVSECASGGGHFASAPLSWSGQVRWHGPRQRPSGITSSHGQRSPATLTIYYSADCNTSG